MKLTTEPRDAELVLRPTEAGLVLPALAGLLPVWAVLPELVAGGDVGAGPVPEPVVDPLPVLVPVPVAGGVLVGVVLLGVDAVPVEAPVWPVVPGVVVVAPGVVPGLPAVPGLPVPAALPDPVGAGTGREGWLGDHISGSRIMVMGSVRDPAPVPAAPPAAVTLPAAALPGPPRLPCGPAATPAADDPVPAAATPPLLGAGACARGPGATR
jgi:hypothetical protein